MKIDIELDLKRAEKDVLNAIRKEVVKQLNKSFAIMESRIGSLIRRSLMGSKTYDSIVSGDLRGEFGLKRAQVALDEILDTLASSVKVVKTAGYVGKDLGGIYVQILDGSHSDILSKSAASYKSNGSDIDWLEWLLVRGSEIIIRDYRIFRGQNLRNSRTGQAVMVEGRAGWRVPPEYAGNLGDNWITNILNTAQFNTELDKIVQEELAKRFP